MFLNGSLSPEPSSCTRMYLYKQFETQTYEYYTYKIGWIHSKHLVRSVVFLSYSTCPFQQYRDWGHPVESTLSDKDYCLGILGKLLFMFGIG